MTFDSFNKSCRFSNLALGMEILPSLDDFVDVQLKLVLIDWYLESHDMREDLHHEHLTLDILQGWCDWNHI